MIVQNYFAVYRYFKLDKVSSYNASMIFIV